VDLSVAQIIRMNFTHSSATMQTVLDLGRDGQLVSQGAIFVGADHTDASSETRGIGIAFFWIMRNVLESKISDRHGAPAHLGVALKQQEIASLLPPADR
jgi:hypothetical protein